MAAKSININKSVYELCREYPEIRDILYDLGFEPIKNDIAFNTVARAITLEKASKIKNIDLNDIIKRLEENGFETHKSLDERNEDLKNLIKRLHNGENIEKIKEEFKEKLDKVSAIEIHKAMHELVEAGMELDEAKRFFYTRSLLLKDGIDNKDILEKESDYEAIEFLRKENRDIEGLIEKTISSKDAKLCEELYDKLHGHYTKKESLFFTGLYKYGNKEPSKVMTKVDKEILEELKDIISKSKTEESGEKIFEKMEDFKYKILDMIFKEENILIPLVISTLSKKDLEEIKEAYLKL